MAPEVTTIVKAITSRLPQVYDADKAILTKPFLDCCQEVIPIIESFGTGFYPVKADLGGNIDRLRNCYHTDPERYQRLWTIVEADLETGYQANNRSCTKGLLWLKRALEFLCATLRLLVEQPQLELYDAAATAYAATLKPYHGFIAGSAFSVGLNFAPRRAVLLERLANGADSDQVVLDLALLVQELPPLLATIHSFLESRGCNFPDKV